MNILIASDDNYINPALVLIKSLIHNTNEDIHVFYMYYSLKQKSIKKLERIFKDNSGGELSLVRVDSCFFDEAPVYAHFTKETYFRFLADKYLPQDIDKVLYLDPDIVINGSIQDFYSRSFYDSNNKEMALVACEEKEISKNYTHLQELNMPEKCKYFNAGVLLINLKLMRKEFDIENVYSILTNYKNGLVYLDQDILNMLFHDKVIFEDYRLYIHFAGPSKPWKYGYKYCGKDIYLKHVHLANMYSWYLKSVITSSKPYIIKKIKKAIKKN